jgi:hypothetical protein
MLTAAATWFVSLLRYQYLTLNIIKYMYDFCQ